MKQNTAVIVKCGNRTWAVCSKLCSYTCHLRGKKENIRYMWLDLTLRCSAVADLIFAQAHENVMRECGNQIAKRTNTHRRQERCNTLVRPVYENMPIWLMMWSQVPGAPTSLRAACNFSLMVMILSAMPFNSTYGIIILLTSRQQHAMQVHSCSYAIGKPPAGVTYRTPWSP